MFLTAERQNINLQSLDKIQFTVGDRICLHFSPDGKEWTTFSIPPRVLHKILVEDREARDMVGDPEVQYKRMNGHSFFLESPEE